MIQREAIGRWGGGGGVASKISERKRFRKLEKKVFHGAKTPGTVRASYQKAPVQLWQYMKKIELTIYKAWISMPARRQKGVTGQISVAGTKLIRPELSTSTLHRCVPLPECRGRRYK